MDSSSIRVAGFIWGIIANEIVDGPIGTLVCISHFAANL